MNEFLLLGDQQTCWRLFSTFFSFTNFSYKCFLAANNKKSINKTLKSVKHIKITVHKKIPSMKRIGRKWIFCWVLKHVVIQYYLFITFIGMARLYLIPLDWVSGRKNVTERHVTWMERLFWDEDAFVTLFV